MIAARAGRPAPWARLAWRDPAWGGGSHSAAAWLLIASGAFHRTGGHAMHDHAAMPGMAAMAAPGFDWRAESVAWAAMVVAMMIPLMLAPIEATATRSLWRRRHRAVAGFLAGYLGVWIAGGAAALGLVALTGDGAWLRAPLAVGIAFAVAAGWQLAPIRRRAVVACHKTVPLAPRGWRADRDCVAFGVVLGRRCVVSCWAGMVACVVAGHSLPVMVGIAGIALAERIRPRPDRRALAGLIAALGVAHLAAAALW